MGSEKKKTKTPPPTEDPPEAIKPGPDAASPESAMFLLDGASVETAEVVRSLEDQTRIVADVSRHFEERIDAYDEIIDSEVGDTSLTRARNIERELGLRQIYIKFEGGNPTGTQKDRISFAQVKDALRRGFDAVTVATCGNYGSAMALAASLAGIRCVIFIPEQYHTKRVYEMTSLGAEIVRATGDYEAAVQASSEYADRNELYDANPGRANATLQMKAYGGIANELYDELRDAPAALAAPVSNGTTLAGIYKGFLSLYRRGKTSRMPRMIAGSSHGKNPIIHAFRENLLHCEDLPAQKIRETTINEPLINWHSSDGNDALYALRATGGYAANATDKLMLHYARMLRDREGLHVLPASTAGLIGLVELHKKVTLPGDRYVVVATGRGS